MARRTHEKFPPSVPGTDHRRKAESGFSLARCELAQSMASGRLSQRLLDGFLSERRHDRVARRVWMQAVAGERGL